MPTVLGFPAAGDSVEDVLAEYPALEPQDVPACLGYASRVMANRTHKLVNVHSDRVEGVSGPFNTKAWRGSRRPLRASQISGEGLEMAITGRGARTPHELSGVRPPRTGAAPSGRESWRPGPLRRAASTAPPSCWQPSLHAADVAVRAPGDLIARVGSLC